MFSIVSDKHSSKVISFILDLLTPLIQQSDSVSQELMDIILSNIIEPFKVSSYLCETIVNSFQNYETMVND